MNQFIESMSTGNSLTDNGMVTNHDSGSAILDLYFLIGAARFKMGDSDIIDLFDAAYKEDPKAAFKILFYARDIEKGLGERRVFRVIIKWLLNRSNILDNLLHENNIVNNIIRVDDLVYLANEMIKSSIASKEPINRIITFLFDLLKNKNIQGIVAKWMPRKNSQYGAVVKYMRANGFIKTYSEYRHLIVGLTNVVEQTMSAKKWSEIELEHVPSLAMKKYKKAFFKHSILKPYLDKVITGEAKLNAKRLYPYDVIHSVFKANANWGSERTSLLALADEQWKNLSKLDDLPTEFRALPIIDVSGSMSGTPLEMALGIGFFMAEHNPNPVFRNHFISFSMTPRFEKIYGSDINAKVHNAVHTDWQMNTNLEAVFELVLSVAKSNSIPESDMPTHLVIISDMEFDRCTQINDSAITMIKKRYTDAGYVLPTIVFWNVNGRPGNVPVRKTDKNVLLVSGASQNVINFVLKKGYDDLLGLVNEVIQSERYSHIN